MSLLSAAPPGQGGSRPSPGRKGEEGILSACCPRGVVARSARCDKPILPRNRPKIPAKSPSLIDLRPLLAGNLRFPDPRKDTRRAGRSGRADYLALPRKSAPDGTHADSRKLSPSPAPPLRRSPESPRSDGVARWHGQFRGQCPPGDFGGALPFPRSGSPHEGNLAGPADRATRRHSPSQVSPAAAPTAIASMDRGIRLQDCFSIHTNSSSIPTPGAFQAPRAIIPPSAPGTRAATANAPTAPPTPRGP